MKHSKQFQKAFDFLDTYQKEVISYEHPKNSYLSVEAPAGSGKSTTMVVDAQSHIEMGVTPKKIVMTTFSKNSVIDLQHKYKKTFPQQIDQPVISTLHKLGLDILKANFEEFKTYKIKTSGYGIMATVLEELGFLEEEVMPPEKHGQFIMQLLEHISCYQSNNVSSPFEVDTSFNIFDIVKEPSNLFQLDEFYEIMGAYTDKKTEMEILTFDDMLYQSYWNLKEDEAVLKRVQSSIDVLICDESQDMDSIQFDFIELLVKGNESIKVVAVYDYLQTLYKFRYATPERLLAWGENKNKLFSITKKLPLIMNYRSDANIVKANNLLRRMGGQLESVPFKDTIGKTAIEFKTCYVNILEGNEIVNTIKDLVSNQGYKYSDIAVIIRTNKFLKEIVEPAIIKADIPYRTANTSTGAKLLDRELSNYLFNALSIYDDSEDAVALIAILSIIFSNENELYRDQIANLASKLQKSKKDLLESLEQFATADFISEKALRIYKEILEPSEERILMVNILHHFSIILLDIINELKMDRAILRDGQLVINSIVNMVSQIAHDKKINTLPELIKLAIEVSETYNGDTTEDCISIGSIHSAKGMEYRVTISAGFTSGKTVQDTDNDLLEKFYVQTSRAIEKSILISSLSFQSFGDESKILDESGFTEASILSYFVDYKKHCRFSGIAINSGITIE